MKTDSSRKLYGLPGVSPYEQIGEIKPIRKNRRHKQDVGPGYVVVLLCCECCDCLSVVVPVQWVCYIYG